MAAFHGVPLRATKEINDQNRLVATQHPMLPSTMRKDQKRGMFIGLTLSALCFVAVIVLVANERPKAQNKACIEYLRTLNGATQQFLMANGDKALPTKMSDLDPYF